MIRRCTGIKVTPCNDGCTDRQETQHTLEHPPSKNEPAILQLSSIRRAATTIASTSTSTRTSATNTFLYGNNNMYRSFRCRSLVINETYYNRDVTSFVVPQQQQQRFYRRRRRRNEPQKLSDRYRRHHSAVYRHSFSSAAADDEAEKAQFYIPERNRELENLFESDDEKEEAPYYTPERIREIEKLFEKHPKPTKLVTPPSTVTTKAQDDPYKDFKPGRRTKYGYKQTALYPFHNDIGCTWTIYDEYKVPLFYHHEQGGIIKEHNWCRSYRTSVANSTSVVDKKLHMPKASIFDLSYLTHYPWTMQHLPVLPTPTIYWMTN
jgi:hypothetical protein